MLKQLGINSLWLLFTRVTTQALSVVFIAIVARSLGAGVFGQYTLLAATVYIGNVFTTYGTDALLIREIAREKRVTPLVSTVLWVQISLSVLWCLFAVFAGLFLTASIQLRMALVLYNLSLLPLAFYSVVSAILRALERMDLFMGLNLCNALLQVLGAALLIRSSADFLLLCTWLVTAQVLTALMGLLLCRLYVPGFSLKMKLIAADVVSVIKSGWRLALFYPLGLLTQRLNVFFLSRLTGDVLTGWFSAAARLVEGLKLGHFALLNGLMPEMSRPDTVQRQRMMQSSLFGLLLWSFIPAIGITFFADSIISIIYGQAFGPSADTLTILAWSLIPYTFSSYFSVALIMRGAEAVVFNANLICLIAAIFIYLLLIPRFGLRGAAWGALVVESLLASLLSIGNRRLAPSILNVN